MTALLLAISLCWDVHPDPSVTHFRVYKNDNYITSTVETKATIGGLEEDRMYKFNVTAVNLNNLESDKSDPIEYVVPRLAISRTPIALRFKVPIYKGNAEYLLESTADFKTWREEIYYVNGHDAIHLIENPEQMRFFRIRINILPIGCAAL